MKLVKVILQVFALFEDVLEKSKTCLFCLQLVSSFFTVPTGLLFLTCLQLVEVELMEFDPNLLVTLL